MAADVCKALGIKNPSIAVKPLGTEEWSKSNLGQHGLDNPSYVTKRLGEDEKASFKLPNQRGSAARIVSESGLYKTISKMEQLAKHNMVSVEENTSRIAYLHEQNLDLTAEAQAAKNIAANLAKLIENETGEIKE